MESDSGALFYSDNATTGSINGGGRGSGWLPQPDDGDGPRPHAAGRAHGRAQRAHVCRDHAHNYR